MNLPGSIQSLLEVPALAVCTCYEFRRTDGVRMYFTTHNSPLRWYDGTEELTFSPVGSFKATAQQQQAGLKDSNLEFTGMITDDRITDEDMRAMRYLDAEIIERTFDLRFPFRGPIGTRRYWIDGTNFNHEQWNAQLAGISSRLRNRVGFNLTKKCRHKLGPAPSLCGVDTSALRHTGLTVTAVSVDRRAFTLSGPTVGAVQSAHEAETGIVGVETSEYFQFGTVFWVGTAGSLNLNTGLTSEIKSQTGSGASTSIALQLATPFDVQVGDELELEPGCAKTIAVCGTKYNRVRYFGGFPHIPGTAKANQYPDWKEPDDDDDE